MSFNSTLFIFGFLPLVVAGYYLCALTSLHRLRLPFLIVATLGFYARGSLHFLPLLVGSIVANYVIGILIARSPRPVARAWLWLGVSTNVAALLWFKYAGFLAESLSAALGVDLALGRIALPLAISFYTFQQIGHLVDLWRGRIQPPRPIDYGAFILFFPQLLAGPISLSREMVPQLSQRPAARDVPGNILVGLTMFGIGLFKKTVIADSFALWSAPMFDSAAHGAVPATGIAWGGVLAYTLQIYFDFSGYSDMAIGCARLFGILLPLNFHSPLRSRSIIDLWRRWHITLGRFVQTYVFQPMVVPLTRYAMNRNLSERATLVVATLFPTFVSMLIIGAWHGANWTFVLFGAMHGSYMMINEAWNFADRHRRKLRGARLPTWRIVAASGATLLAFVLAVVPFRSADLPTTFRVFAGMAGGGGANGWNAWPVLTPLDAWGLYPLLVLGLLAVYLLPNTQEILSRAVPALEWERWRKVETPVIRFEWRPTAGWAVLSGAVLLLGIVFVARGSTQFVYFGF